MGTLTARKLMGLAASAGALLAISCSAPPDRHDRAAHAPAGGHAVHTDRLRAVMLDMGTKAAKRWPQEIAAERAADARRERELRFEEARQLAEALAGASDEIPRAIEGVELTAAERGAFVAKAELLRAQADRLEAQARQHEFEEMRTTLNSIRNTCNDCHRQFRELSGPVHLPANAL